MSSGPKVSAVVLTKNEQDNILRCLKSLNWCTEVIVIDDYSSDRTLSIAEKSGTKTFQRKLAGNFAAQRNFGLSKAQGNWVLFIDADERISNALAQEIKAKTKQKNAAAGYTIKRQDYFMDRKLRFGETAQVNLLRLARQNTGKWVRPVHETWAIKGKIGQLKHPLDHYPHQKLSQFLAQINYYSDIEAKYRTTPGKGKYRGIFGRARLLLEMIFFPLGKFLYNYLFLLGFLDGLAGLVMAMVMSLHSLLVRVKIYEKISQSHSGSFN